MKNDRIGLSPGSLKKSRLAKDPFKTESQKIAEREYEEYYNKIRQLSRGQ